jgi:outer membrane protein assembly factor BamB
LHCDAYNGRGQRATHLDIAAMDQLEANNERLTQPRIRWWPLAVVIVTATGIAILRQQGWIAFTDKPSRDLVGILVVWLLAVYLVVRLACRLPLTIQVGLVVAIAVLHVAAYAAFRVDGFTGDGRLILAWRWTPTAEPIFERECTPPQTREQIVVQADLSKATSLDSPQFRGPHRDGVFDRAFLSSDWMQSNPTKRWSKPIGGGWSSFAVVGDYAVTQEQRGSHECVVCYHIPTGDEVWLHRDEAKFFEFTSGVGPRATPTLHQENVYSLGATGLLTCLEGTSGKLLWTVDITKDCRAEIPLFGFASSPLVVEERVFVIAGGKGTSLVGYNIQTGEREWSAGDSAPSYSSPELVELQGTKQILCFNHDGIMTYDLQDGRVLWTIDWPCDSAEVTNVCQPVVFPGENDQELARVFVSSGYSRGCALYAIHKSNSEFTPKQLWRNNNLKSKFSSVVVRDGFVYGLDEGILTCLELASGERRWKRGRYGYGQIAIVGNMLLVQCESGEVAIVEATPDAHKELNRFRALADRTWNHPVLSKNRLLLRNDREMASYELPSR